MVMRTPGPIIRRGAFIRAGGNTTEATTTSTTAVDLLSATGLAIAALTPIVANAVTRKTSGAAATVSAGLTVNATAVRSSVAWSSSTDRAEEGGWFQQIPARLTNYVWGGYQVQGTGFNATVTVSSYATNAQPTVAVTSLILVALVGSALVTQGADEMHVYALAAS